MSRLWVPHKRRSRHEGCGGAETREDFTTYDETDPNARYVPAPFLLEVNGLTGNEDTWHSDDKGVDHFGATWLHYLKVTPQATSGVDASNTAIAAPWAVTNVNNKDAYAMLLANDEGINLEFHHALTAGRRIILRDLETGNIDTTANNFWTATTPYYLAPERTSETAVQCGIYSTDADMRAAENALDTLVIAITSGRRYRYAYGLLSWQVPWSSTIDIDIADMELNE